MVNEPGLYFDIVHVIETLGEYHTGRRLFEDLEPISSTATPQVSARFNAVRSVQNSVRCCGQSQKMLVSILTNPSYILRLMAPLPVSRSARANA